VIWKENAKDSEHVHYIDKRKSFEVTKSSLRLSCKHALIICLSIDEQNE